MRLIYPRKTIQAQKNSDVVSDLHILLLVFATSFGSGALLLALFLLGAE
jgi:hypothetical protein